MIVTRLKLANVRAIGVAEFTFKPGFNLLVGVNGVGKTTVLETLAVCLAGAMKRVNRLRGSVRGLATEDIRATADALTVECQVEVAGVTYTYVIHTPRHAAVAQSRGAGLPREEALVTPEIVGFDGRVPPPADGIHVRRPLAVLFSTRRAVPSDRAPTKGATSGGVAAAFAEAFSARELRLGEFAAWMRAQKALADERPEAGRVLEAFENAIQRFLPGYANLRVADERPVRLLIDRGGVTLQVRQLSDGERGALALVLDLTRRLAQANPETTDPAQDGEAIVLIDEIDLHLHPKWQRQIVQNLSAAFPRSQFIATTHSPQVIGEVAHDRIQIMANRQVFSPTHSFGVDSSRVLEEIMDAPQRTPDVYDLLSRLSREVSVKHLDEATRLVAELAGQLGDSDPEVVRARTLLDFMGSDE